MTMPMNLVLVCRGQSADDEENGPSPESRLSGLGCEQAEAAGKWIKGGLRGMVFDRYYVPPYARAGETAVLLDLPTAKWSMEPALCSTTDSPNLYERVHGRVFDSLHRDKDMNVLVVCDAEVIVAIRVLLENFFPGKQGAHKYPVHNGNIVHYTRRDPIGNTPVNGRISWVRSICPTDESRPNDSTVWGKVYRRSFGNDELHRELQAMYPEQYK